MIVVDASALAEILLGTEAAASLKDWFQSGETFHAPHLIDLEIAQVMRRLTANRVIDKERGRAALADLAAFPLHRHAHQFLLAAIWELRNNFTAYDAAYVTLAALLDATFLTRDRRLASAAGSFARVELV